MNLPDFSYEKKAYKKGFRIIAGMDEVGRGCFAGPVVTAVVVFGKFDGILPINDRGPVSHQPQIHPQGDPGFRAPRRSPPLNKVSFSRIVINDSKKLSPEKRELASFWIKKNAYCYGIGKASVAEINKFGIKKACEMAFRRAIRNTNKRIDYLLIDAFYVPYIKGLRRKNQNPIIKGDTKSISIAAASIIAKVYRDKLMTKLSQDPKYKKYKWDINKGYGTPDHRNAIRKFGTTKVHRKQFVETYLSKVKD